MDLRDIYIRKFTEKANKNAVWSIIFGILLVVFGIISLSYLVIMNMVIMYLIGTLMLIGGILQLLSAISLYEKGDKIFWSMIGALYFFAGIFTLINPIVSSFVFTAFIVTAFAILGIFRIIASIKLRPFNGWQWSLFSGVLSILVGILIFTTPGSFTWIIGLFISTDMIFQGTIYMTIGLTIKSLVK